MRVTRRQLRQIIIENLLLEGSAMSELAFINQLARGDAALRTGGALQGNQIALIQRVVRKGLQVSPPPAPPLQGAKAVVHIVNNTLPKIFKTAQESGRVIGIVNGTRFEQLTVQIIKACAPRTTGIVSALKASGNMKAIRLLLDTGPGRVALNTMSDASAARRVAVATAEKAGALKKPASQITNAIVRVGRGAAGTGPRTAQQAARLIINNSDEAAVAIRQIGANAVKGGTSIARIPQGNQLVTTAANAVATSPAPEVAANASKLSKFLKFLGPLGVALFVLDVFYAPVELLADGKLRIPGTGLSFKIGIGVNDMKTPWGQLTYRRKRLGNPPAKPSDFNDEYKNVIATIIWNQRREGEEGAYAKEWTQTAIREDLIDVAAWKAYLEPWRQAEARIQEGEQLLAEEGEEDTGPEDFTAIGDIDANAMDDTGADGAEETEPYGGDGSSTGDQENNTATTSTQRNTSLSNKISKIQRLIGMRPDGEWSRDVNIKLGAFAVAESLSDDKKVKTTPANLEWWKDWKNSAPKIKKITVGGRNMTFGSGGNPPLKGNIDSLIKVLEFIKESRESMNENLSRGSLIRKRYWGRY